MIFDVWEYTAEKGRKGYLRFVLEKRRPSEFQDDLAYSDTKVFEKEGNSDVLEVWDAWESKKACEQFYKNEMDKQFRSLFERFWKKEEHIGFRDWRGDL
jgi:hypothetical protein